MIFIDCETTGLNTHKDRVTLFQYHLDGTTHLIQDPNLDEVRDFLKGRTLVGHNLSFDLAFLGIIPEDFHDTLYLDRIVNYREESHSLDDVARRVLGHDPYAGLDKKKLQKSDWAQATLSEDQIKYAKIDVDVLPIIYADLIAKLPKGLKPIYNFDKKSIIAGLKIQRHGLPILRDKANAELTAMRHTVEELKRQLHPLNCNSPKQVTQALKVVSSADKVLAELQAKGNTTAKLIREARGSIKQVNFLEKLVAAPRFKGSLQPAARSGRFTSSKENIQNLPRITKSLIGSETNVVLSADFAQLELRTVAAITNDYKMVSLFCEGKDLHSNAAEVLFGSAFTKEQRQIAKVFNFATLYGSGAATIRSMLLAQTGIVLSEDEVRRLKRSWLEEFRGIKEWQRQGSTRHTMSIPWRTPHGRPYTSDRFTDHLSIENQGAGAEIARIALHIMLDTLPDGAELFDFVHDSYWVEAPNDPAIYKPAAAAMKAAMEQAWDKAPFDKRGIPMPVEVGVAHNIKDADSLENCIYVLGE